MRGLNAGAHIVDRCAHSPVLGGETLDSTLSVLRVIFTQEHWCASIAIIIIVIIIYRAIREQLSRVQLPPAHTAEQLLSLHEQQRLARQRQQAEVRKPVLQHSLSKQLHQKESDTSQCFVFRFPFIDAHHRTTRPFRVCWPRQTRHERLRLQPNAPNSLLL